MLDKPVVGQTGSGNSGPGDLWPKGALDGLRILDLSRVLAGPWCAQILGDLGAEVIKIEQPGQRDDTRTWRPPWNVEPEGVERARSAYYLSCNRNKHSVAINLASDEGADLIRQIAASSDVVIENFKCGGLAKYGLDYASLSKIKPDLIYCSITGFGQTGPYAHRGGYDFLIQGMSGLMSITGQPDGAPGAEPLKVGVAVSDLFTGLYATISILAAVQHRRNTGIGQHIDLALLDTQVAVLANQAMNWLVGQKVPGRLGNGHPNVVPYRCFATSDGHIIVACGNDRQFRALTTALGREDLRDDPRFADNSGRQLNRGHLEAGLEDSIAKWTSADVLALLEKAGVPCGPINRIDQIFADPHIAARGLVSSFDGQGGADIPVVGFPARLSASPATYRKPPPHLGADTETVLEQVLGLTAADTERLRAAGVIG